MNTKNVIPKLFDFIQLYTKYKMIVWHEIDVDKKSTVSVPKKTDKTYQFKTGYQTLYDSQTIQIFDLKLIHSDEETTTKDVIETQYRLIINNVCIDYVSKYILHALYTLAENSTISTKKEYERQQLLPKLNDQNKFIETLFNFQSTN